MRKSIKKIMKNLVKEEGKGVISREKTAKR